MKLFRNAVFLLGWSFLFLLVGSRGFAADRPNVVWIVSEDNSKHYLKLYDEGGAETPNIAKLAEEGLLFDHAFSNAPVCSVARTTLATGCYGPRIGTQFHRRSKMVPMPDGLKMWTTYLREDGYYTSNNSKTDYNAEPGKDAWDDSSRGASWRNRKSPDQPFFHMESHAVSHESSLHFTKEQFETEKTKHDPAKVVLPPYFPDTELFRYTYARYLDNQQKVDDIVGQTVAKLKEDGVLEDTFIFYFGDHGGVLPRSKGYLYESGLHVPLVVRIPEKWKHLVDAKRGDHVDGFVSFVDFGATVLQLAGVPVPQQMDGRAFLGKGISMAEVNQRDETFGYADRFDEKYDLCRSVRIGKWKYIRNFQPWYPDGLQNNYRYIQLAYQEWREMFQQGKLNEVQSQFFRAKPAEMLFDVESDPHEVTNLATNPAHEETLKKMRDRLATWMKDLPDLSLFPESELYTKAFDNPVAFGQKNKDLIGKLIDVAQLEVAPIDQALPKLEKDLASREPEVRYWAASVSASLGKEATELTPLVRPLLNDAKNPVRMRAAEFLGIIGKSDPRTTLLDILKTSDQPLEALEVLNAVVAFRDGDGVSYPIDADKLEVKASEGEVDRRVSYLKGMPGRGKTKAKKSGKKGNKPKK